jgi:hypothetical protein
LSFKKPLDGRLVGFGGGLRRRMLSYAGTKEILEDEATSQSEPLEKITRIA